MKPYYLVGGPGTLLRPILVRTEAPIPQRYLSDDVVCVPHTGLGTVTGSAGPNWSPHDPVNSMVAALLYQPARANKRWDVLRALIRERARSAGWISGDDLELVGGTEALRRKRELEDDYDWPIQSVPPPSRRGVWSYRLLIDRHACQAALRQVP